MPAPRKTPARKAPAKKTAAPKPADAAAAARNAAFESLRQRAAGIEFVEANIEPYVLGPDMGFDPPIVIKWPENDAVRWSLELAARRGDAVAFIGALVSDPDMLRIIAATYDQPDAKRILYGLYLRLQDHFFGAGAGDVPGGTPAS
ncbi:hypothetical protein [Nocardia puris]|uniref:Tail assembly chaperone n=1 Tax=Nocardia puris TaxID=208602 RepID=A0A366DC79_9NOCA|nr:hypothetical protein [Nocardia puris]RBO87024.1 hypothetical protein DFR74_112201 [Nocardia puris]